MKTLYVSDLDGTLLRSDQKTSDFTNQTINELVENGMLFSYATARSYIASKPVTEGLEARIPLIVYNGSMVVDNADGRILLCHYLQEDAHQLLDELIEHDIYPIVFSMIDCVEKMSYVPSKISAETKRFIDMRDGDIRIHPVDDPQELHEGDIFDFTCIDQYDKLKPFYEKCKDDYQAIFQLDIYTNDPWLEILPKGTSKANAIKEVVQYYQCDKVVVFGDGVNDIEMFKMADEAYAVENAVPELKELATGIIAVNNDDGVAKWLKANYK